jgi:GNAT superfamily N-acetyltransferase
MEVLPAGLNDIANYTTLGRVAQAWLLSRGLGQYVPAAHDEYAAAIQSQVESGTLFAAKDGDEAIGFFDLGASPSPWWPADGRPALYLAGMIVARPARGRGLGSFIIEWCITEGSRRGCQCVRLDCHADNIWLSRYYEAHGFELCGQVEQHPGYFGCLYERRITVKTGRRLQPNYGAIE